MLPMPWPMRSAPRAWIADHTRSGPSVSPAWGRLRKPCARARVKRSAEGIAVDFQSADGKAQHAGRSVRQGCVQRGLPRDEAVVAGEVRYPADGDVVLGLDLLATLFQSREDDFGGDAAFEVVAEAEVHLGVAHVLSAELWNVSSPVWSAIPS